MKFADIKLLIKEVISEIEERDEDAEYVEYLGPMSHEEPFMLRTPSGESKFEYCYARYPSGKKDIAVYSYRGDVCYGYQYFRKAHNLA